MILVLYVLLYILNLNNKLKFRVPKNVIVGTIICDGDTIMCDISTINVRFYVLEVPYQLEFVELHIKESINTILILVF